MSETLLVPSADFREPFLETLSEVQEWFDGQGIEYRVIGSLATSSYIESPDSCSLDFNRADAVSLDQRIPDIDLIVPRIDLPTVRAYRMALSRRDFPVKLGLGFPSGDLDFRPDADQSFLTHSSLRLPVDSRLFKPVERDLLGTKIITVEPITLFHTYVTCGGRLREKDLPKLTRLGKVVRDDEQSALVEADFEAFHEFIDHRKYNKSLIDRANRLVTFALDHMTPRSKNRVKNMALPIASRLGLR